MFAASKRVLDRIITEQERDKLCGNLNVHLPTHNYKE